MASQSETSSAVLTERRGRVAILTINRPEARNAINADVAFAMDDALNALAGDDAVWVVVITGAGDRAFSAGQDLKAVAQSGGQREPGSRVATGGFAGITQRSFPKPLIAAVNGFALGGGCEICLACDLVVAEEHAQFGLPEVKRGVFAGAGGMLRMPTRVPPAIALELGLTGEPIDATRAAHFGLVNQVVPKGQGVDAAVRLAEKICEASPLAVRLTKAVMREVIFGDSEADIMNRHKDDIDALVASDDFREGPRAFVEKRSPRWTGH